MEPSIEPVLPLRPDLNETQIGAGDLPDTVAICAILTENKARNIVYVTERWTPTPEEREAIANGADVYVTLLTADGSPMPVQVDAGVPAWLYHCAKPGCCDDHPNHKKHLPRNHIVFAGDETYAPEGVQVKIEQKILGYDVHVKPTRPHFTGLINNYNDVGCMRKNCTAMLGHPDYTKEECTGED